ncbi:MAG: sulfurtransferase, partial [Alphaproteobacteria bacterium]
MALLTAMLFTSSPALAATPLVDPAWVKAHIGDPGVVFLDVRTRTEYLRAHVPGAIHTDYVLDGWRVDRGPIPAQLPEHPASLSRLVGGLGIDTKTHVVILPEGRTFHDVGIATRIYWTLKLLGVNDVSILNGGQEAYEREATRYGKPLNPLETGMVTPIPKTFSAIVRTGMLVSADEVDKARQAGTLLVDTRPEEQFTGAVQHPTAKSPGTIPGARNLPASRMTVNGGGLFPDKKQLEAIHATAGIPPDDVQIAFCNTGHNASINWFVTSELIGNKTARLYSGSLVECPLSPCPGGPGEGPGCGPSR